LLVTTLQGLRPCNIVIAHFSARNKLRYHFSRSEKQEAEQRHNFIQQVHHLFVKNLYDFIPHLHDLFVN
jgi:RecB family exonuclease